MVLNDSVMRTANAIVNLGYNSLSDTEIYGLSYNPDFRNSVMEYIEQNYPERYHEIGLWVQKSFDKTSGTEDVINVIERKSPQETRAESRAELEEAVMKLLKDYFLKIAEKELGWNVDILRRQNSGAQGGHDIFFRYGVGNRYVTCLVECKSEKEVITLDKLSAKLLQADKINKNIDHWILISPNAQVSNDMEGDNLGSYLHKLQQIYPFKIHVWDKTKNIKELFGLCPEVYDIFFWLKIMNFIH